MMQVTSRGNGDLKHASSGREVQAVSPVMSRGSVMGSVMTWQHAVAGTKPASFVSDTNAI